jgi:hypothetical protein
LACPNIREKFRKDNVDRYLVSGATALLFLQIGWLLNSLGLVDLFQGQAERNQSAKQVIGQLIQKRENVKRKGADSIIWEESNTNDTLYRYDSVLTLDNSTAQLSLEGDVKLQIHENTLVMLEPLEQADSDTLRVRFYRGQLRSRNSGQRLSLGTGEWSVEAKPGTDLSLRALEGSRVELEINKGEVHLANKVSGETQVIDDGKKLTLNNKAIEVVQEVNTKLQFVSPTAWRIYSHTFPLTVPVSWQGPAKFVRLVKPNRVEERVAVGEGKTSLSLEPGTYSVALEDESGSVSSSSTLEIIPAPKIRYLNPLPRDRISLDANYLFSWYPAENIGRYEVQLDSAKTVSDQVKKESQLPYANVQTTEPGEYAWSVYAYDSDGFVIPPFYSLPVFFTPKPLAAPKLNAPEQRLPSSETKSTPDDQGFLKKVFEKGFALLIPSAQAEPKRQVSLSWYPVEGADFYIIEISSTADFLKPEVIKKTKKQEFLWADFKNQVYYWRVAGGTNDGRMGVFSEPEKFDVAKLSAKAAGATGPSLVEKPAELPKTIEVAKPEVLKPAPEPITPTKPIQPDKPTKPVAKSSQPTVIDVALNFDYWLISQKNDDINKVEFNGMALPSFVVAKTWNVNDKTYVTQLSWHSLKWKPENLPYQSEFDTQIINFKIFQEVEAWSWGLAVKQFPFIERQALEQVKPSETVMFGGLLSYQKSLSAKTIWRSQASILYGDGYIQTGIENKLQFYMQNRGSHLQGDSTHSGFYHGGLLDTLTTSGDNGYNSLFLRVGYEIGYRW